MFKTALRNVFAHKARLLMTVLAVLLGVAFVSGTLVFTDTLSQAYRNSSMQGFQHVDVALEPSSDTYAHARPGEDPRLPQHLLKDVARIPGVASVTGEVSGFTAVADKHGKLVGSGFSTHGGNYYAGADGTDPRYPMRSGRAPRGPGEVALDSRTAAQAGYHVGDRVRLSVDGPVRTETLSGVFHTEDGAVGAGGTLALFDDATAQKLFAAPGQYDRLDVTAAHGTSQDQLRSRLEKALPKHTADLTTGSELAEEQASDVERSMATLRTNLLVFAGIALFVGIFLIANTFTMLVSQRTRELALLRAVGAARRQVTRSVLIEATLVGLIASVAGLAAGVGVGAGLRSLVARFGAAGSVPDGPLVVTLQPVLVSLVVGVGITVLAAWLPARRAARIPPVAAMSSVHATATTKSLVVRNCIGAVLTAAGAATVVAASGMGDHAQLPMSAGAGLLMIGVFVLTPLLSRPLIALASPVLRLFGVAGRLARRNAVRNPRRTAATASALMVGMTLITGLTVLAGSAQQAVSRMATESLRADYVVSMVSHLSLSPEVAASLAKDPHVTAVSPLRNAPAQLASGKGPARRDDEPIYLTGVEGRAMDRLTDLDFRSGSFRGLTAPAQGGASGVVVDTATAKEHGWHQGSVFRVTYEDGRSDSLRITGLYRSSDMIRGVLLDDSVLATHQKGATDMQVLVRTAGGASQTTKDALEKRLGDNPAVAVQDKQDLAETVAGDVNLMLNMLYGLLGMAVVVAVLGVVNTLAMSVFERSQEIGMLRAVGLEQRGVRRMVRLESLVISLFGGVLGIGLGVFFGWAAGEAVSDSITTYVTVLPWGRIAVFLALAAVVGVLAALWPARRATRLNMLAAIRAE
ncbi:ABC transporter permease [Streptomyces sp. NPDC059740]|uniref:ABC transporter permease n=1 Tax=Streptomyces sp. NPDC059740 TaxID=3346926 RepID=UPI00366209DC